MQKYLDLLVEGLVLGGGDLQSFILVHVKIDQEYVAIVLDRRGFDDREVVDVCDLGKEWKIANSGGFFDHSAVVWEPLRMVDELALPGFSADELEPVFDAEGVPELLVQLEQNGIVPPKLLGEAVIVDVGKQAEVVRIIRPKRRRSHQDQSDLLSSELLGAFEKHVADNDAARAVTHENDVVTVHDPLRIGWVRDREVAKELIGAVPDAVLPAICCGEESPEIYRGILESRVVADQVGPERAPARIALVVVEPAIPARGEDAVGEDKNRSRLRVDLVP